MPRSTILLRASAVTYALFTLGHTYGAMYEDPKTGGLAKQALFAAMRSYTENLQGFTRSYWDFYRGFGFNVSWFLLGFAILSWQLSSLARTQPSATRPLAITLFAISIPITVLAWTNFFAAPGVLSSLGTVLLGAAVFSLP